MAASELAANWLNSFPRRHSVHGPSEPVSLLRDVPAFLTRQARVHQLPFIRAAEGRCEVADRVCQILQEILQFCTFTKSIAGTVKA